jgi:hypothetical protein
MEFKEKIRTINFSKFTVTPVYKKIDKVIETIQYDKDRLDAALPKSPGNNSFSMKPLKSYPKEFVDYIYQQVRETPKPDLNVDMPKEAAFNVSPQQIASINVLPEDRQRLEYIVEKQSRQ